MYNTFLDGVQFPIAPGAMTMKINNKNETLTLVNEGEVNILKKPGLTDIDFELDLPNVKYPFAVYPNGFQPAAYYLDHLEKLKLSQRPFQFILNRMKPNGFLLFDTNITVSLEDYTIEEDAENGFDIKVSISLKQFKLFGTKKIILPTVASAGSGTLKAVVEKARSTESKVVTTTHKVTKGDTLWAICKRYYGKADKAVTDALAKKNSIKDPSKIYVGQVINL